VETRDREGEKDREKRGQRERNSVITVRGAHVVLVN
jgi:hypothetical protein